MMQLIFWLKVVTIAGGFGAALGLAPYLIRWLVEGHFPTLETVEFKAVAVLFVLPSVSIWATMAQGLINKRLTTAIACGLAWPFVTLLIGVNLNRTFHFDVDLPSYLAVMLLTLVFVMWVLVLSLGVTAGVAMHRVVNAHYSTVRPLCPEVQGIKTGPQVPTCDTFKSQAWTAFGLSILPGLGQLYNGEPWKAVLFYVLGLGGGTLLVRALLLHIPFEAPYNVLVVGVVVVAVCLGIMTEAFLAARRRGKTSWVLSNNRWFVFVAIMFVMGFIVKPMMLGFVDRLYASPGMILNPAMTPTILPGDRLLVDRRAYIRSRKPQRGDIIYFQTPHQGEFIRRVVGVPGDTVDLRNQEVLINGRSLGKRNYARPHMLENKLVLHDGQVHDGPVVVPEGEVFVLADNRESDWGRRVYGSIPIAQVWGRIAIIFWSWEDNSFMPRWDRIGDRISSRNMTEFREDSPPL
jgi:signal peptidase I